MQNNRPNLYWLWESAVSKEICEYILKNTNWKHKENGRVGTSELHEYIPKVRVTEIVFDHPLSLVGCILRSYITSANKQAKWNYAITDIQSIQIGRYVDGGHYSYHKDAELPGGEKITRKLSAVLFLSDPNDYEGGLFEFKALENNMQKFPQGSIIVFPSYVEHRVTPVISGERHTAVCWSLGPSFK
jgi:PKHD-type hydroxylase